MQAFTIKKTSAIDTTTGDTYQSNDQEGGRYVYEKSTSQIVLSKLYNGKIAIGVLTHVSYNETTGTFTDTIMITEGDNVGATMNFVDDKDRSEFFAMNCKVAYNTKDQSVLDVFLKDSKVLLSGVIQELEDYSSTDTTLTLNGVKYVLQSSVGALPTYAFNVYQSTGFMGVKTCFDFKLIDNNNDDKADCAVCFPYSTGKVLSLENGYASFSTCFGNEIPSGSLSNIKSYDGISVRDDIRATLAPNTVDGKMVLKKIDTIDGTVTDSDTTAKKPTVVIRDETYTLMPGVPIVPVGTELKNVPTVNYCIFPQIPLVFYYYVPEPAPAPLPVAVLLEYAPQGDTAEAPPTSAIISLKLSNGETVTDATATYVQGLNDWLNRLVAYEDNNGVYTLYPCDSAYAARNIGCRDIIAAPAAFLGSNHTAAIEATFSFADNSPYITPEDEAAIGFAENAIIFFGDSKSYSVVAVGSLGAVDYTVINAYTNVSGKISIALLKWTTLVAE